MANETRARRISRPCRLSPIRLSTAEAERANAHFEQYREQNPYAEWSSWVRERMGIADELFPPAPLKAAKKKAAKKRRS